MEMGEPCQPKYYLLMVVSRCWGGACLVAASLLLTRAGAVVPIMQGAMVQSRAQALGVS